MSDCKHDEQIARLRLRLRIVERYMAELLMKKDRDQLKQGVPPEDEWPKDICSECLHRREEHAYNLYQCQKRIDGTRCPCNEFFYKGESIG